MIRQFVFALSLLSLGLTFSLADETSKFWDTAIEQVTKDRDRMTALAVAHNAEHLGAFYNEVDVQHHTCSILGIMLGKTEFTQQLSKKLPVSSTDGHDFQVAAQSLDNWLVNVRRLLRLDTARRVREWNLDCVGQLGVPTIAAISQVGSDEGAFFDVDGTVLRVLGAVEVGFADKLTAALDGNPQITVVALGSEGGVVREALRGGIEIRRRGLDTTLWNNCYSACPLVFAGGVSRTIWSPYPKLGFHSIHVSGEAVSADNAVYRLVSQYLVAMNIEALAPIQWMLSAPPSEMYLGEAEHLCETGFATWIQRACSH